MILAYVMLTVEVNEDTETIYESNINIKNQCFNHINHLSSKISNNAKIWKTQISQEMRKIK